MLVESDTTALDSPAVGRVDRLRRSAVGAGASVDDLGESILGGEVSTVPSVVELSVETTLVGVLDLAVVGGDDHLLLVAVTGLAGQVGVLGTRLERSIGGRESAVLIFVDTAVVPAADFAVSVHPDSSPASAVEFHVAVGFLAVNGVVASGLFLELKRKRCKTSSSWMSSISTLRS